MRDFQAGEDIIGLRAHVENSSLVLAGVLRPRSGVSRDGPPAVHGDQRAGRLHRPARLRHEAADPRRIPPSPTAVFSRSRTPSCAS
ncbi:hypothetical protein ACRAWD_26660 [Caulobacter segnis]